MLTVESRATGTTSRKFKKPKVLTNAVTELKHSSFWLDTDHLQTFVCVKRRTDDREGMRAAGKLAAETLEYASTLIEVGVTTDEIDEKVCN